MASVNALFLIIFTTFVFCFLSAAHNVFIYPPPWVKGFDLSQNDVFTVGSTQLLQWTTNHPSYNVLIWQQNLTTNGTLNPGPSVFGKALSDTEPGSTKWQVQSYQFDLAVSNVFYFALTPKNNVWSGFESHFFNLTNAPSATSSTTASMMGPANPSSSSPSAPTATRPTVASPTSPSSSLPIGIGVGLPLIGLLGMAIGYCTAVRRGRAKNLQAVQEPEQDLANPSTAANQPWSNEVTPELPGKSLDLSIYEAPGSVHTTETINRRADMAARRYLPAIPRVASGMRCVLAYGEEPMEARS